ncbi:MAG TPA: RIP metalloprotease RseP, partial [Deltaproteobacteria bacterium]|nr:RIP metalloprotease RseP [Deltaproteobacteria bacterium]
MFITIVAFIIVLGILIFFHELGHFLVAKANGVGVLKFSLGFGPALVKKRFGETEYMISALPLGGYVKMLGEDEHGDKEIVTHIDPAKSFSAKPLKVKAAIVAAGPGFNLVLAVLIYTVIAWVGIPTLSPTIGTIQDKSPAYAAGLMSGDRIISIGTTPIKSWEEIPGLLEKSGFRASIMPADGSLRCDHRSRSRLRRVVPLHPARRRTCRTARRSATN